MPRMVGLIVPLHTCTDCGTHTRDAYFVGRYNAREIKRQALCCDCYEQAQRRIMRETHAEPVGIDRREFTK